MAVRRFSSLAKRLAVTGIAVAMSATTLVALPASADETEANAQARTSVGAPGDVIAIAFQTNWNSVAKECTEVYGPEGVGYVQVSPPMESIQGTEWWTSLPAGQLQARLQARYGSRVQDHDRHVQRGGRRDHRRLGHQPHHRRRSGERAPASPAAKYDGEGNFPAIPYTKENFHDCTKNIGDYTNADEVQNCRPTSLQDLDTSQEYVQDKLADYMNRLLDLGVYGFRVDAVKHTSPRPTWPPSRPSSPRSPAATPTISSSSRKSSATPPKPRKSSRATMWRTARSPNSTSPTTCRSPSPATSPTPARALRRSAATAG